MEAVDMKQEKTELFDKNDQYQCIAGVGEFPSSRRETRDEFLPLEDPDLFSEDPFTFEEMTNALIDDAAQIYNFSKILNRFSEKYLTISRSLEKALSRLASCCLTKAVLEKKGYFFPSIDDLTVEGLYRMLSFNFRKCHAAIEGTQNNNYQMWSQLMEMEYSWFSLAGRLKATEEKIQNIYSGKINADHLIRQALAFRKNSMNIEAKADNEESKKAKSSDTKNLPPSQAKSFPVLKQTIRETVNRKSKIGSGIAESKHQKSENFPSTPVDPDKLSPANDPEDTLDAEFRKKVMEFNRNNEEMDRLIAKINSLSRPPSARSGPGPHPGSPGAGPANETRKKLRQKRKKKK